MREIDNRGMKPCTCSEPEWAKGRIVHRDACPHKRPHVDARANHDRELKDETNARLAEKMGLKEPSYGGWDYP